MARAIKRICPGCGKEKLFRADQKTCGCKHKAVVVQSDSEVYLRKEVSRLNTQLSYFKENSGYNKELNNQIIESVKALEPLKPVLHNTSGKAAESDMAAVFKISDWHTGAKVNAQETEGFGQYNWDLEQERMQYIAQKWIGWTDTHRKSFRIPKAYILSEGDLVSGDIHYELQVTNEFPTPVQAVNAGSLLAQTVATLAPHFDEIHLIEVNIDNHSRLTKKLQFAQGGENSWGFVAHSLANALLKDHKNVNVRMAPGLKEVVNVEGVNFLVEHGHEVKAWMGIPFYGIERMRGKEAAKRMQAMLDQERQETFSKYQKDIGFDYLSCGHWHVPGVVSGNILINGSLMGTTEFDHGCGRHARPSQVSFLVHPKYKLFDWTPWSTKR